MVHIIKEMENIIPYHYDQLPIFGKKGYFYENSDFHRRGYRAHHSLP